jgi:hypothetical protein
MKPWRALLAAGIVGFLYTLGGYAQMLAGLITLAVLLTPGPNGRSMLAGLLDYVTSKLQGE